MEDSLFYEEQRYQIIDNIQELDFFFSQKNCDQVQALTISLLKEDLRKFLYFQTLHSLISSLKEIYLDLSFNGLNNIFLIELQNCLNNLKHLQIANIKIIQNQFTHKQAKKFIIYIQNRFQIKEDIECSFNNKQISFKCGKSSVSYIQDFNKSILIKEGLTKSMKIIISKDQDEFQTFIKQCLKQEIDNLQVIIYFNNKKIAVCQINLHFEEENDLNNYIFSHHDIAHININSNNSLFSKFKNQPHFCFELSNGEVDVLLFQNSKYTEKKQKFIYKQITDERFSQISKIYFYNNSDVQFAKDYILSKIILAEGKLIQNTISFYFLKGRDESDIFVKIDPIEEIDQTNERQTSFYFFDVDIMIKVFNAIFSLLQNLQLTLYGVNLYKQQEKQIAPQSQQFFLNMVDQSLEYNIQILNVIEKRFQRNNLETDLLIPIIEKLNSVKELCIQTSSPQYYGKFLDDNIKYFQKNKQKCLYHLILDFSFYVYHHYTNNNIIKAYKQYSINNINAISLRQSQSPLLHYNVSKCKRLVSFNYTIKRLKRQYLKEKYYDEDYYYRNCYYNYYCDCYKCFWEKEEIFNYKDLTYFYT